MPKFLVVVTLPGFRDLPVVLAQEILASSTQPTTTLAPLVRLLQRPVIFGTLFQDGQRATLGDCLRTQDRNVLVASCRQNVPDLSGSGVITSLLHTICVRIENIVTSIDAERIFISLRGRCPAKFSSSRTAQYGIS
jgi:hypothetical protein